MDSDIPTKTVGEFTLDGNTVIGPAQYMEARYPAFCEELKAGRNEALTCCQYAPHSDDPDMLYLQALQLDFAGWHGVQTLLATAEPKELPPAQPVGLIPAQVTRKLREGQTRDCAGYYVNFDGFGAWLFVLTWDAELRTWYVIETTSGFSVASDRDYSDAIEKARRILRTQGPVNLAKAIEAAIARH